MLVVPAIPIQISIIESKYCRGAGASILQEEHGGKASHDGGEGASDLHAVSSVGSDYDWDSGVSLDLTIGNLCVTCQIYHCNVSTGQGVDEHTWETVGPAAVVGT